jgi:glutathione S-transferase
MLVDQGLTLSESNAIRQYVAEAYGGCRAWSREPRQPGLTATPGLAQAVAVHLGIPGSGSDPPPVNWTVPSFVILAKFLDDHLRGRAVLVGSEVTIADFSVAGMMTYARVTEFPFGSYPNIRAWHAGVEALEAWKTTAAGPWTY